MVPRRLISARFELMPDLCDEVLHGKSGTPAVVNSKTAGVEEDEDLQVHQTNSIAVMVLTLLAYNKNIS